MRTIDPRFEFTDPPLRHSLPVVLDFAATAGRPAAVLTGPATVAGPPGVIQLPRPLQQILFDTADGVTSAQPVSLSCAG